MPTHTRRIHLDAPPDLVFDACLELLRAPDPARGIVARRLEPDPPCAGGAVISTLRVAAGEREVRARIVCLDRPSEVATQSENGPLVTARLRCEPAASGGTEVTYGSEVASGLPVYGRSGRVLDSLMLGRRQRATARATLRRLGELVRSRPPASGGPAEPAGR